MRVISFFILFLQMEPFCFSEQSDPFEKVKIVYSVSGGEDSGDSATFAWSLNSKICQVILPGTVAWKKVQFESCMKLHEYLLKNSIEFKNQLHRHKSVVSTHLAEGLHVPLAQLEMDGVTVSVRKNKSIWCDEKHANCVQDAFDLVDDFAKKVRNLVAEQLDSQ